MPATLAAMKVGSSRTSLAAVSHPPSPAIRPATRAATMASPPSSSRMTATVNTARAVLMIMWAPSDGQDAEGHEDPEAEDGQAEIADERLEGAGRGDLGDAAGDVDRGRGRRWGALGGGEAQARCCRHRRGHARTDQRGDRDRADRGHRGRAGER